MTSPTGGGSGSGFHLTPKMITIGVIAILAIIFIFQNTDTASLKVLFFTVEMPRWIAFLILLAIGIGIGYVLRGVRDKRRNA